MSYITFLFISGVIFLSFDNNKFLQILSTFLRILVECNNTVLCNSTIWVVIPISFSRFGNLFGVVPSAPTITGITFTFLFHSSSVPVPSFDALVPFPFLFHQPWYHMGQQNQ